MDLHLSGKTAVVTGASKGIGLAITAALVEAGAHVVAGGRSRGDSLSMLEERTGQVSYLPVDLSQPDAAEELVAAAPHRGGIDVLACPRAIHSPALASPPPPISMAGWPTAAAAW